MVVNPKGIKTLLANGFSTFFIPVFSLALFPALQNLETRVLVNNNLCGKLFSPLESPSTFDESFKITSVPLFIPDLN